MSNKETAASPLVEHQERMRQADERAAALASELNLDALPPSLWHKKKTLVFDLETTGVKVNDDRIVTASVLEVFGNPFDPDKVVTREWLVNPGVDIPSYSVRFHGVTTEQAQEKGIDPAYAVEEIIRILGTAMRAGYPVIGFNVSYDFTILDREAERHGVQERIAEEELIIVDPSVLDNAYDKYRPGKRKLADVVKVYGVRLNNAHNSTADCLATAQVAYNMAETYIPEVRIPVETLMSWQRIWRKNWAAGRAEFFASIGRDSNFNPHMGYQPLPGEEEPVELNSKGEPKIYNRYGYLLNP